jgi:penicillin G amidase
MPSRSSADTAPQPRHRGTRLLAAVGLGALLWLGARGAGPVPALGPVLDPVRGAWALSASAGLPARAEARVQGLGADTRVLYDDRAVPHIFAASEADAWRALGYVTARDRLFQLDLQARAGGGTLTELLGAQALRADRATRGLGMGRAAERIVAAATGDERQSLEAYAAGVNAYIDAMAPRDLPLEYRLLGRRPARWSPLRSVQVVLRMQHTLTRNDVDLEHLRAAAAVGEAAADALFPLHSPIQEPIQPSPGEPRQVPMTVPPPGAPDSAATVALAEAKTEAAVEAEAVPEAGAAAKVKLLASLADAGRRRRGASDGDALGSNNWAVAPGRTRAGPALLAGDPHLDLTLPSVWYEARIQVPGVVDAYGVTIPGLPAILLGFNRDLAWSFTNSEADLMDRWIERVDDPARPSSYLLDDSWVPIVTRLEAYLDPDGDTLALDTVRFSHRGPMRRLGRRWLSTRWTALEGSGALGAIHRAARARSARAWLDAMTTWGSPPQNLLVADRAGTIGIRTTGRFPIRAGAGRGDRVHDGTTRASDWIGDWAPPAWPQLINPAQGFLASANQEPQDPRDQPHYLGANWLAPWRALRINHLLRHDSAVTAETMRRWQTDPGSARAEHFVPYLVGAARTQTADTALAHAASLLAAWDCRYMLASEAATLFEAVMPEITARLWDELPAEVHPGAGALLALLDERDNAWWDDRHTPERVEHRDDILVGALRAGYGATVRTHGAPEAGGWRWSSVHRIDINHLLGIPSLSARNLSVPGGPSTISPSSVTGGTEGSSWRMVVELGPTVRGWGTYPGGQSGNPASPRYDDRLAEWTRGGLSALRFPPAAAEIHASARLVLRPLR